MTGKTSTANPSGDPWSEWILRRRHGDDASYERVLRLTLASIRDRVLDGARMTKGGTVLDVGCGDGLIGLGALERMGGSGRVVFFDISESVLRVAERRAIELGWRDRASFVLGSADRLAPIADGSVGTFATRACLAYVEDKASAVREAHRVLKPGGRVSIAEPIFRDQSLQISRVREALAALPPDEATARVRLVTRWKAAQFPSTRQAIVASPLTNFSEWDLVRLFQESGFSEIHLELHIDVRNTPAMPWETFIDIAPHPLAPTLRELLNSDFSAEEASRLEAAIRPSVESGAEIERNSIAYLTAVRPG